MDNITIVSKTTPGLYRRMGDRGRDRRVSPLRRPMANCNLISCFFSYIHNVLAKLVPLRTFFGILIGLL